MRVVVTTEIAAPRPVVWEYLIDPDRYREFMDGMTHWKPEGNTRHGLGARFSMRMRIGAAELGNLIEVVEFDPPADLAWTSVTGVDQRGRWRLRAVGERTHVELRISYYAAGGIMARLADLVAAPIVRRHLQRSLQQLKRQVETPARQRSGAASIPRHGRRLAARVR